MTKHLRRRSITETGKRAPNAIWKSGKKLEAAAANVDEMVEKSPIRSHEGWGRALKMAPNLRNTEQLIMFEHVNSTPLSMRVTEN